MKFQDLRLSEPLLRAIGEKGYTDPTPIQQQAIPPVLEGRDLQGCAQTGTGKTAAFTLPMLQLLAAEPAPKGRRPIRALVLTPTRELAIQIDECCRDYARYTPIRHCVIFGGVNQRPQVDALQKGVDLLVATPGRLLDLIGQGYVTLDTIRFFVLDEADRMLDMGFIHDIRRIVKLLPAKRQTLMFSATFSTEIRELADSYLNNPVSVEIAKNKESTLISQEAWSIAKKRKRELLRDLIVDNQWDQVLVFTRMKHTANRLASQLEKDGIVAAAIHGNKSQSARTKALAGFKDKSIRVLVATDIAARGLDIEGLPHVINYELPNVAEDYVHRIGRTGRAGVPGHAVSLVSDDEKDLLSAIEKLLKKRIDLKKAEGYEGEPPADIVADEKERDAARKRELEKLRESRRKQRKEKPAKTEVAKEVHEAVKLEAQSAGISDNPDERFEKKIRRKPQQKTVEAQQPQVTKNRRARREPNPIPRGNNGQVAQDTRRSNERNGAGKTRPARRGTPGTDRRSLRASWEPADPFAPENQAIFLPQTMPGNFRSHQRNKTRPANRRDPEGNRFGQERRRSNASNIKSTVQRAPKTAYSDSRFESVSSNLPPGMILRMRRR